MQSKPSRKIYLAALLVLVFFLGLAAEAMASHFRYGHITWTRDSGTSKTVTFRIQTAWRVLFGGGDTRLFFGDGNSQTGSDAFVGSFTDLAGATYVVHERYVTHTYATLGTFEATNSTCCRIGGLGNPSSSWAIRTTVDLSDPNQLSSSVGSVTPLLQMAQGVNSIPIGVADPDGAVTCRMATSGESGISSVASTTSGTLSVSPSCVLNWDASTAPDKKKYAVQVMLLEGTNKTALDFLIEINAATGSNQPPTCNLNGATNNTLTVGQAFSISATATDPDGDNLKVTHLGLPPGATLTPANGTTQASPATATFNWTPGPSDQGTGHSVLLVFTDTANQSCQTSFSVNIPSAPVNQAPSADAGPDQVIEQTGPGAMSVTLDGSGSSDPDGDPLTYNWSGGATASGVNPVVSLNPGVHNITLTVDDGTDSDTDSVQITVQDTIAPVVTVSDRTEEATGPSTPVDVSGDASATDAVGVASLTNNSPGTFSANTTTVVTWTACDAAGNCSTANQNVTIQDTIAPVITVSDRTEEATGPSTPVDVSGDASATDAVGVASLTNNSPGTFSANTTTVVTWTACDAAGNCSTANQNVTIQDTIAPALTPPADVTADATGSLTVVSLGTPTATDAVGVVSLTNDAPAGGFPVDSTNTVTWTACDAAGNCSTATQTVTVKPFDLGVSIGKTKLKIHRGDGDKDKDKDRDRGPRDWLQIAGTFTEFSNGDGLNWLTDPVTIVLNGFTWNLPPGSFTLKKGDGDKDKDKDGDRGVTYKYKGGRTGLTEVRVDENGNFKLKVKRMDLSGLSYNTPIPFAVTVGNDFGETDVTFNTRRGRDDDKDKDRDRGKKRRRR